MPTLIQPGLKQTILAASTAVAVGTTYAVPQKSNSITWRTSYNAQPSAATVLLQGSMDNVSFFTLDTTTAVGGETRTVSSNVPFIRTNVTANVDPKEVTVEIMLR